MRRHRLGITLIKKSPVVEDDDLRAVLRLIEIRGRPDHGHAFFGQRVDHAPQLAPRNRVDADARLIEKEKHRRLQHRAGESEFLLHPAGEVSGKAAGEARQIGEGEQTFESRGPGLPDDAAQIRIERQVFEHGQVFVEPEALRHVADGVVERDAVLDGIVAAHREAAFGRDVINKKPQSIVNKYINQFFVTSFFSPKLVI